MNLKDLSKDKLLQLLIETVHSMSMYPNHKTYTQELMRREKTDLNPKELAVRLNMTLGEVLVILQELEEKKNTVQRGI
jgi:transcription initiation factor IIE alpha subunit